MSNEMQDTGTVEVWADTVRVRILSESDHPESDPSESGPPASHPQQPATTAAPEPSFDPYNTAITALAVEQRPRRSLDDMRRLSEAIVRTRGSSKGNA